MDFGKIRDTSVLVRLRPAWEDLRSYLIARGRKRFEVYVCTMAERDYALEMWRLLDPDSNLINSKELLGRIVCVKSGKLHGYFCKLLVLFSMTSCIFAMKHLKEAKCDNEDKLCFEFHLSEIDVEV